MPRSTGAGGQFGPNKWLRGGEAKLVPVFQKMGLPDASALADMVGFCELAGATIDVVAGHVAGVTGPMVLSSATTFAVVHLKPGASAHFAVDEAELGVYSVDGAVQGPNGPLAKGTFAMLTAGSAVTLTNADAAQPAIAALVGGEPAQHPILFAGPFVTDSEANIARAQRDYASGAMGRLNGVPF